MKSIALICAAVLAFIVGVVPPRCLVQGQPFSCYNCTAYTSTDSCGTVGSGTPTNDNCLTCSTALNNIPGK